MIFVFPVAKVELFLQSPKILRTFALASPTCISAVGNYILRGVTCCVMTIQNTLSQIIQDGELTHLADKIACIINEGKNALALNINATIIQTYWNIGRYIVEFEQSGKSKSQYGTAMLTTC